MGSGLNGDTDLNVPGTVSLAINGSSFDAPLVGATTSGSTAYTAGGKVWLMLPQTFESALA